MIAIVHALALNAGLIDNDAERYCSIGLGSSSSNVFGPI